MTAATLNSADSPYEPTFRVLAGPPQFTRGVVAIGNFDGVHRGHQQMMRVLVEQAKKLGGPAVALTFDPHPLALLRPHQVPTPLTTIEERGRLLQHFGADTVLACRISPQFLALSAVDFFQQILVSHLDILGMVEGPNFAFGRKREGNVETLRQLCLSAGRPLEIVTPIHSDGQLISSSTIRELLERGRIEQANALLGHSYRLTGQVVEGAHRGTGLGFPTANLGNSQTMIPGEGVYAGRVTLDRPYRAAIHIGPNPTFGEVGPKIEVHLLDYAGDLYGRLLSVEFIARVRDVRRFSGRDELISQLTQDLEAVRKSISITV